MRKASEILLIIGAILSFVGAFFSAIASIPLFFFASNEAKEMIVQGINDGTIHVSGFDGSAEQLASIVQGIFLAIAIVALVCVIPMIVAGILALLAKKKQTTGLYVSSLVIGIIFGGNVILLIGSIFGLVENSNTNQN